MSDHHVTDPTAAMAADKSRCPRCGTRFDSHGDQCGRPPTWWTVPKVDHDESRSVGQVVKLEAELAEARAETERFQYAVEAMRIVAREAINLLLRLGAWGLHSSKQQGLHVEALALRDRLAAVDQLGQAATVEEDGRG